MTSSPLITPQTKVGELLEVWPELEPILIEAAPAFKKLRSPILRKTVARVTSLAQAAKVGNIPITDLVNRLREAVGQEKMAGAEADTGDGPNRPPEWYDPALVSKEIDARPIIDAGDQPLGPVMQALRELDDRAILKLIAPFEPAPLIEQARSRGYVSWTEQQDGVFHTYFKRHDQ